MTDLELNAKCRIQSVKREPGGCGRASTRLLDSASLLFVVARAPRPGGFYRCVFIEGHISKARRSLRVVHHRRGTTMQATASGLVMRRRRYIEEIVPEDIKRLCTSSTVAATI